MINIQEFVPFAQATQRKWQVPASLSLSAFGLESNWGQAMPPNSNNGFGIKALPGQAASYARSPEVGKDGKLFYDTPRFRIFASIAEAFDGYGELLGLGKPYRQMMTTFLNSQRRPENVQNLSMALGGVYGGTPSTYGPALIRIQKQFNLYQYDDLPRVAVPTQKEPKVSFSFSSIFGMLTNVPEIITDIEALLQNAQVQELEALIEKYFTHTVTPGSASVIEPKTTVVTAKVQTSTKS